LSAWLARWRPFTWTVASLVGLIGMLLVDGLVEWLFLAIACAPVAAGAIAWRRSRAIVR
jgi:xanthosine utilization system XapX-like protein